MHDSDNEDWWSGGPSWVEYAKQAGAHVCICPVCDREHEPDVGGWFGDQMQDLHDMEEGEDEDYNEEDMDQEVDDEGMTENQGPTGGY